MDDVSLFEKIKESQDENEKIQLINLIQSEGYKEGGISLLSDENKLLMIDVLQKDDAKSRILRQLINNENLIDAVIEKTNKLKKQTYSILVLGQISDNDYEKKINAIADLFINNQYADDDSRRMISERLEKLYDKMKAQKLC